VNKSRKVVSVFRNDASFSMLLLIFSRGVAISFLHEMFDVIKKIGCEAISNETVCFGHLCLLPQNS
jgi:hypothetical protein